MFTCKSIPTNSSYIGQEACWKFLFSHEWKQYRSDSKSTLCFLLFKTRNNNACILLPKDNRKIWEMFKHSIGKDVKQILFIFQFPIYLSSKNLVIIIRLLLVEKWTWARAFRFQGWPNKFDPVINVASYLYVYILYSRRCTN